MGKFRALKPLQASSIGLQMPGSVFDWSGNIIGWHVEPLDDEARAMVEERAKQLRDKGIVVKDDAPLPTQPFPKSVMAAGNSGMRAPQVLAQTMSIPSAVSDIAAPDPNASPAPAHAPPKRRKAG